jgi:hypothetical protein
MSKLATLPSPHRSALHADELKYPSRAVDSPRNSEKGKKGRFQAEVQMYDGYIHNQLPSPHLLFPFFLQQPNVVSYQTFVTDFNFLRAL